MFFLGGGCSPYSNLRVTKGNPPLKWTDIFEDYCLNTFGVHKSPLSYIIRETLAVLPEISLTGDKTIVIDPLPPDSSFGINGSVLDALIPRLSHINPLYKTDKAKVHSAFEEATRSTAHSSTVKAFSCRRNGRVAWKALINSHAGNGKWEQLQKDNSRWIMNTK